MSWPFESTIEPRRRWFTNEEMNQTIPHVLQVCTIRHRGTREHARCFAQACRLDLRCQSKGEITAREEIDSEQYTLVDEAVALLIHSAASASIIRSSTFLRAGPSLGFLLESPYSES